MDFLLPHVPYRQWVLTIPKRLRYFINRDGRLAGDLSRLLAETLTRFYQKRQGSSGAPAQMFVVQRFGSRVNLHVHLHAAVSDGIFELNSAGKLAFLPAEHPSPSEMEKLIETIRTRWIGALKRRGVIPEETARQLLSSAHSGFSLHAAVRVEAEDRAALERLLRYFLRPALSLKRLDYRQSDPGRVRYHPLKGRPGEPAVIEWSPEDFLERFARIIPPPRYHLVRHSGALGPRSKLRPLVTRAAQEGVPCRR